MQINQKITAAVICVTFFFALGIPFFINWILSTPANYGLSSNDNGYDYALLSIETDVFPSHELCELPESEPSAPYTVSPSRKSLSVQINGNSATFEVYYLYGTLLFAIEELQQALDGTQAQFSWWTSLGRMGGSIDVTWVRVDTLRPQSYQYQLRRDTQLDLAHLYETRNPFIPINSIHVKFQISAPFYGEVDIPVYYIGNRLYLPLYQFVPFLDMDITWTPDGAIFDTNEPYFSDFGRQVAEDFLLNYRTNFWCGECSVRCQPLLFKYEFILFDHDNNGIPGIVIRFDESYQNAWRLLIFYKFIDGAYQQIERVFDEPMNDATILRLRPMVALENAIRPAVEERLSNYETAPYISEFGRQAAEDFLFKDYLHMFTGREVWENFGEGIGWWRIESPMFFEIDDSGIPGITMALTDAGSTGRVSYKFIDGQFRRVGLWSWGEMALDGCGRLIARMFCEVKQKRCWGYAYVVGSELQIKECMEERPVMVAQRPRWRQLRQEVDAVTDAINRRIDNEGIKRYDEPLGWNDIRTNN